MCEIIKKRNGHKVPFDPQKPLNSVERAYTSAGCEMTDFVRMNIMDQSTYEGCETVDDIADVISKFLYGCSPKPVYDAYVGYRRMRDEARKKRDFESIINVEKNDITNDNANMSAQVAAGMAMKIFAEDSKKFALENLLEPDVVIARSQNYLYPHDLDYYSTKAVNCLQQPADKYLYSGYNVNGTSARPCKRIESASAMICIGLQTSQNEMFGGQAIPAIDFYLAPAVRTTFIEEVNNIKMLLSDIPDEKYWDDICNMQIGDYEYRELPHSWTNDTPGDDRIIQMAINKTVKRTHQAMESLIHNLNHMKSRGGCQVVFSSINYGTDTSPEGRLIIRELLECCYEGVGDGSTAIFPIHVMKCKEGVNKNPGDPNYDLYKASWKVCARRFFPNYLNLDASYNKDDKWDVNDPKRYMHEVATMGCRTRVYDDRFGERTSVGRGNLSFTSINIVKLAIESAIETGYYIKSKDGYVINEANKSTLAERKEKFYAKLDKYMDMAAKQLMDRFEYQATAFASQAPLVFGGMMLGSDNLKPTNTVREVIKHGSLSIGFIGLAETLIMLTGKHHGEDNDSQELGKEIIHYMNLRCKKYADQYNMNFSLFGTPAEGLAARFTLPDRKEFGIIENVTNKDFYTNSTHVPVWYHCTPQHKAEIEGVYHKWENAGHIFYCEIDTVLAKNPEVIDTINRMAWANDVGYSSVNHTEPRCKCCSYEPGATIEDDYEAMRAGEVICPKCGGQISTLDRVTGYLGTTFDKQAIGKAAEIVQRVVHK